MSTRKQKLSSPRSPYPPVSPPLSESVLKLQKLGLELGHSRSQSSLRNLSHTTSARSTPSDLDKPLPLEPPELERRTSSVYSEIASINNIIDLYGGTKEAHAPQYHDISAYRDTIAPLQARRMSLTHSTCIPPMLPHKLRTSVSSPVMHDVAETPLLSSAESKNAPSFMEFSRNLRERKHDTVSPFTPDSLYQHRQEALGKLAPPSPQTPTDALPVAFEQPQSFLPGPMSARITDVVALEMLPQPLDFSHTSQAPRSPQQAARLAQREQLEQGQPDFQQPDSNQSWEKIMEKLNARRNQQEREKERVLSYAAKKYSGLKRARLNDLRKTSQRSSGGSSVTQRASDMVQNMSRSSGKSDQTSSSADSSRRRQKQVAVKATPYQEFGPDIWLPPEKLEKKRKQKEKRLQKEAKQEAKKAHRRNQSSTATTSSRGSEVSSAYLSGQSQIVGAIRGAKQRLSRSDSERRREKLKKNIVLVGPAKQTRERNSFEGNRGSR